MKTKSYVLVLFLFLISNTGFSQETSIKELFTALKANPTSIEDDLAVQNATSNRKIATSNLYPSINAFGTYDYFSVPTAMLPVPPNELFPLIQDQTLAQPFSDQIYRVGAGFTMPIYIQSLFTSIKKTNYYLASAEAKHQNNLIQNQAIIVTSLAYLDYFNSLIAALENKKQSLLKTKEIVDVKVRNGRAAGAQQMIIDNAVNQVEIAQNDLKINKEQVLSSIKNLTNIRIENPILMRINADLDTTSLKSLLPLEEKLKASELSTRAEKEKLLPSVFLKGNYSYNWANAYNNGNAINNDYTAIGLAIQMPIFSKSQYSQISKSKIETDIVKNELEKSKLFLETEVNALQTNLINLKASEVLYQKNIVNLEQLLQIAKISFDSQRITIEDYLKYEDDLLAEKAKSFKTKAEIWQTQMKLAVIYGNNIENIVE